MSRLLIQFHHLSVAYPQQECIRSFSERILSQARIALLGDNGVGKSSLLKLILEEAKGQLTVGYLPQVFSQDSRSGGEQRWEAIVDLFTSTYDLLLLDEPTNHLDAAHRRQLREFLDAFEGAAIIISHDEELLVHWPTKIWQVADQEVRCFDGAYLDFVELLAREEGDRTKRTGQLRREQRKLDAHVAREERRKARSRKVGRKRFDNDPFLRKRAQERAEKRQSHSSKQRHRQRQEEVDSELAELRRPKVPQLCFYFDEHSKRDFEIEVRNGAVGYGNRLVLMNLNLTIGRSDRLALIGPNGCGKTTVLRALMGDPAVLREGSWRLPTKLAERTGYLDQHYSLLDREATVWETIRNCRPDWSAEQVTRHLGAALFVHHATFEKQVGQLSEGERCRLVLARIAARAPDLLILDEVTNNLDATTKVFLVAAINSFPGAVILSSHQRTFLSSLEGFSEVVVE